MLWKVFPVVDPASVFDEVRFSHTSFNLWVVGVSVQKDNRICQEVGTLC